MPTEDSGVPRGTATDRSECRCPDCLSYEGVEEIPEAAHLYDDPIDEILYASRCANGACRTDKIDPKALRKQIDKDAIEESEPLINFDNISIRSYISKPSKIVKSFSWKAAGVILLFVLAGVFGTLGGFGGGGEGIAEAGDSYQGLETESGSSPDAVYEAGNWTVYEAGDSYITSGVINDSIVYLTSEGQVTDSPYLFGNLTAAKEAIDLWQARNDQMPSEYPPPDTPDSLIEESNWKVFSYNGSYLVAGKIDGEAVFLQPNGDYVTEPYFYEKPGEAEQAILYWVSLTQTNDLPTVNSISKSQLQGVLSEWDSNEEKFNTWNDTDLGNWTIYSNGSSYLAVTSINGTTVYLQPNGSTSTSKATFGTKTDLIDTLDSWRDDYPDVTTEPLTETPDLSSGWDPIDYQDTIPDDSTSDSLTTVDDDPITSGDDSSTTGSSGATIAGTVKDTNDQPVKDAKITLHSNPQTTTTDSNGEFTFSGVPEGDHTIHIAPPDGTNLAGPRNTTIQVNSEHQMKTTNDPENVLYFETDDGTVAQNHISFIAQQKQPVQISGSGSNAYSHIKVANPSNIEDLSVTFTPEYTASKKSMAISGSNNAKDLTINGTTSPRNQSLVLKGNIATSNQKVTGTCNGSNDAQIHPSGNLKTTNPSLNITPRAILNTLVEDESGSGGSSNCGSYSCSGGRTDTITTVSKSGEYDLSVYIYAYAAGGWSAPADTSTKLFIEYPDGSTNGLGSVSYYDGGAWRGSDSKTVDKTLQLPKGAKIKVEGSWYMQRQSYKTKWSYDVHYIKSEKMPENISVAYGEYGFDYDTLEPDKTKRLELGQVSPDTPINISIGKGKMDYTLNYTARATPTNSTITIDSKTYDYPNDFSGSGPLPLAQNNAPVQINISSLDTGKQPISIETDPIDGIQTEAEATLIYDGETKQSHKPTIVIQKPNGTTHEKTIPDSQLENGHLKSPYDMTVPSHWLGTGKNKVTIRTSDDSVVSATITTKALEYQNKNLNYGS